ISGAVYLRLRSFGNYTGTGWSEPAIYTGSHREQPLNLTVSALVQNGYYGMNDLSVEYNVNDGLVPVPYYTRAENNGKYVMTDIAVPRADNERRTFYYSQIPPVSLNVILSLSGTAAKEKEYRQFVYDNYLDLPESTKEEILKIIKEAGLDAKSPTVISDVAEYVRHAAKYSGAFEKIPDGEDRVIYFLTESKEGICGHFASAATVIYRALGIPARYTVGYYVVTDGGLEKKEFYSKDAHAWVEIYVDSVGWVPVEVTGSSVSEGGAGSELQPPDNTRDMFYNKLYFKMKDAKKVYDGEPLYSEEIQIMAGGNLKDGHRVIAKSDGLTNAGTAWTGAVEFKIVDENGKDVTDMYEVRESSFAQLTVETLIVDMPDITLYVGQTVQVPEYAEILDKRIAELSGSDNTKFVFTSDPAMSVTDEGITGIAATNNRTYENKIDLGLPDAKTIVEDKGAEIKFRQKVTVLPFENVRIKEGELFIPPDTRITGENGKIYNYLVIRSADAVKRFDGKYLTCGEYEIIGGALAFGHTLSYASVSGVLYTGEEKNMFSELYVKDENGRDVTSEYIIDFYPGVLRVIAGEYDTKDPVVTVSVDGEYELSQIDWAYGVQNVPVSYGVTGNKNNVRVQNGSIIGIEAGKTYIRSYLHGADLNGDGVDEYLPAAKTLEVNVIPKESSGGTAVYIILILAVAIAATTVTFLIITSAGKSARKARK
ncbi:MAG: transglutaminase domain-containing protein, partial [Clostridia bacterium]|nr:transglutaminase domain-containing protein [Clostridia bacterium]